MDNRQALWTINLLGPFSMGDPEVRMNHIRTSNDGFLHGLMRNNISSHITNTTLWYFRRQIDEQQNDEYDCSPSYYRVSSSNKKYYCLISHLAKQISQIIDVFRAPNKCSNTLYIGSML